MSLTEQDLIYAAYIRCPCGAGMAYQKGADPFQGYWDCSDILLGRAQQDVKHEAQLPFICYEIKSEKQPSANGATTRPAKVVTHEDGTHSVIAPHRGQQKAREDTGLPLTDYEDKL